MLFNSELSVYLQFVKLEKGLSKNSIVSYENDLKRYLKFLITDQKLRSLSGVTLYHIEVFLDFLIDNELLSASSLARNISSIRGFHEFALVEGITNANPAELIELPKKAQKLPDILNPDEIIAILDTLDTSNPVGIRDKAILESLYGTGMRVSELTNLETNRLYFEIGFIRVIGKGSKERLVPVGELAQDALEHYIEYARPIFFNIEKADKAKNKVFLNQRGGALSRMSIWNIVQKAAKLADIKKKGISTYFSTFFRHTLVRRRSRFACSTGNAWTLFYTYYRNLHPCRSITFAPSS